MNEINIPYIAYEAELSRMERMNRRLWIVVLVLIAVMIATNIAWFIYESQFEDVSVSQDVQQETSDGDIHFVGGDYYGKATDTNNN